MYREMKDSGVRWIGQIPKEWKVSSFKNIVSFIVDNRGKTPPIEDSGIPLLEIDSLRNKYPDISGVRKFLSQQTYDSFLRKYLKGGDILFATVGAIGKTSIVPEEFNYCIAQNIVGFRINESNDKLFWFYYMKSEAFKMTYLQFNKGNIQDSIKISNLMNGKIVQPLISEQQKIANYLDKKVSQIDDIISKQKSLIEKYKAYKQSLITETVTKGLNKNVPMKDSGIEWIGEIPSHWEIKSMKYLCSCNDDSLTNSEDKNMCINYVDISSVTFESGIVNYEEMLFKNAPSRARRVTQYGDIIISTVRTYLKAIAIIPDDKRYVVSTGFAVIRAKYILNRYLDYFIKSEYFINLVSLYSKGISYPAIDSFDLMNIKILEPSIDEQEEIANFLDKKCNAINLSITKKEQLIEKLESYKKSLIYECVTGKREVN